MDATAPRALIDALASSGQSHLFTSPAYTSASPDARRSLWDQLLKLEQGQAGRGGLLGYVERGRGLLGGGGGGPPDPVLVRPTKLGSRLRVNTPRFEEAEEAGLREAPYLAFVVVAGGLGERLNGPASANANAKAKPQVKALLPAELVTRKAFLETQCDAVAALQQRARAQTGDAQLMLPLAVMTSDDTHDEVLAHLTAYQGPLSEITVMKQEKVACFADKTGKLAVDPADPLKLLCKPHGHGDVHSLLHKSGLAARWAARGVRWVVFLQDSNGLAFRAVPAAVGNSVRLDLDVNMVAVSRRKGEAIGAICDVVDAKGVERTLNVEYNLVSKFFAEDEEFAQSQAQSQPSPSSAPPSNPTSSSDTADLDKPSKYPGNINILVVQCASYARALAATDGVVPEFVNPKLKPDGVTFASPVRLECMMQDVPLLYPAGQGQKAPRVGFTELDRFLIFSPVKNNLKDALAKLNQTGYPESASSAESDLYGTNRRLLAMAGCNIRTTGLPTRRFAGLPFEDGARVVLSPSFGVTVAEIRARFPFPDLVYVSERSTLVLDGHVEIHHLHLDGALVVRAAPGARVVIKNFTVVNQGWVQEAVDVDGVTMDTGVVSTDPVELLRAYRLREVESLTVNAPNPGDVVVDRP